MCISKERKRSVQDFLRYKLASDAHRVLRFVISAVWRDSPTRAWNQHVFKHRVPRRPIKLRHCTSIVFTSAKAILPFEWDIWSKASFFDTWVVRSVTSAFKPSLRVLSIDSCSCFTDMPRILPCAFFKYVANDATEPGACANVNTFFWCIKVYCVAMSVSKETYVSYIFSWVYQGVFPSETW